jgi:hypothetical protein
MNATKSRQASFLVLALICFAFQFSGTFSIASATVNSTTIYSPDSKPYGKSYGEWTSDWWEWFIAMPNDAKHPLNDPSGSECHRNQNGPVFFLLGGSKIPVDRTCSIPYGKAVLLPTINNECSTAEYPNLITQAELRNCAVDVANSFKNIKASIDGVPISNITKYNVVSPLFNVTFPEDKPMYTVDKPGITNAVSAGNWVFIDDLSPGPHEIYFKGDSIDYTEGATINFAQEGTYHLNVTSGNQP